MRYIFLTMLISTHLFAADSAINISFTRHLDPDGTEGYSLACSNQSSCELARLKNQKVTKSMKVDRKKAEEIISTFESKYQPSRNPSSGVPLITWEVSHSGKTMKGMIPLQREYRNTRPSSVDSSKAVLALEYALLSLEN